MRQLQHIFTCFPIKHYQYLTVYFQIWLGIVFPVPTAKNKGLRTFLKRLSQLKLATFK